MPDFIKDKRSRTYIILASIILIIVAAIVFFVLRNKKDKQFANNPDTTENVIIPQDPTANDIPQAPVYLSFYENVDTMKLSSDLAILSVGFRQIAPLIDQWLKKTGTELSEVEKDHQELLLNAMEIRNNPQGVNNAKYLKGAMNSLANLLDIIDARAQLGQQQNVSDLHQIADKVKESEPPYNQQALTRAYFAHVYQIVKAMNSYVYKAPANNNTGK